MALGSAGFLHIAICSTGLTKPYPHLELQEFSGLISDLFGLAHWLVQIIGFCNGFVGLVVDSSKGVIDQ